MDIVSNYLSGVTVAHAIYLALGMLFGYCIGYRRGKRRLHSNNADRRPVPPPFDYAKDDFICLFKTKGGGASTFIKRD